MTDYAKTFFAPQIDEGKKHGIIVLKDWFDRLYRVEEASEVLHTKLMDDVLTVTVDKSSVIEYMRSLNQEPSKYYIEETLCVSFQQQNAFAFCKLTLSICHRHIDLTLQPFTQGRLRFFAVASE